MIRFSYKLSLKKFPFSFYPKKSAFSNRCSNFEVCSQNYKEIWASIRILERYFPVCLSQTTKGGRERVVYLIKYKS